MAAYPEDSLQYFIGNNWWVEDKGSDLTRGKLIWAEAQFFSQIPYEITASRSNATNHTSADLHATPYIVSGRRKPLPGLPVAGFPRLDGADCFLVTRAKCRPCLVIGGSDSPVVHKSLNKQMSVWATSRYCLVVPFYSAIQQGRSGYNPALVEKIRHGRFSQFFVDDLPLKGEGESILRFDQTFPIGNHRHSFAETGVRLDEEPLSVIEEWFLWYLQGAIPAEGMLELFHQHIQDLETGASCVSK